MIAYRKTKRSALKILVPNFDALYQKIVVNESELTFQQAVSRDSDPRMYSALSLLDALEALVDVRVVKRNELHTFKALPKRWIAERTFGWLDKCRRLWKNCERLLRNSLQMISLAFIRPLLARY